MLRRRPSHAALAEDVHLLAVGVHEVRHVLHEPEDRRGDLGVHVHPPAHVRERDLLRRGDDDRAGEGDLLRDADLRVARARWHVHEEDVQGRPRGVPHHLPERAHHHRPAPHRRTFLRDEEPHRHALHAVVLQREHPLPLVDRGHAGVRQVHQDRHRRTEDVGVQ